MMLPIVIVSFYFFPLLQMIPVAANDVAFSIHAVLLTSITLFQVVIYDVSNLNLQDIGF